MTDSADKNEPLFAFLGFLDSEQSAKEKTTIDTEQDKEAREAQKIWMAAMQDASTVYAKRRGESFKQDTRAYVTAVQNGNTEQLPALSPMAVLQSEVIGTVAILLSDMEGMIQAAGASGDMRALVTFTRNYIGLKRAASAFAQVNLP